MFERFMRLLKEKGKRFSDVARETGIPYSTFTDWKAGRYIPKVDKLQKIADYFDVSMDYLLTGQEPEAFWDGPADVPAFTIGELQLLDVFKKLSAEKQEEVINYGLYLLSKQNDELKKSSLSSKEA